MILIFLFILGLAIGSFSNVLIDRLANGESILGRSHCDYCKRTLGIADLIPVLSFLFLKGSCRTCNKKLSWQYPLVELLMGGVFILAYEFIILRYGPIDTLREVGMLVGWLGMILSLVVIFITDAKYQIIPDPMQLVFFICAVLFLYSTGELGERLFMRIIAGLCTMTPILCLHIVTRGRGMGFGDVKFAFSMGFLLGVGKGFIALYIGFIIGAIVGIWLMVFGAKKLKSKIAFGPFLIAGLVIMLIEGDHIMNSIRIWYGI